MAGMSTPVKAIPEGYQAVIPYLVVDHAEQVIEFIKQAFGAQELMRMMNPGGKVGHTELRIRDSIVMLGGAGEQWKAMPTMLYLYVENVDDVYQPGGGGRRHFDEGAGRPVLRRPHGGGSGHEREPVVAGDPHRGYRAG